MKFQSLSLLGDRALKKYDESVIRAQEVQESFYYRKIGSSLAQVLLVTLDGPDLGRPSARGYDIRTIAALFEAWRLARDNPTDIPKQEQAWRRIDQIGRVLRLGRKIRGSPILRHFRTDPEYSQYFLLLNGGEPQGIPTADLNPICNIRQLVAGRLPLHAAGVIHKSRLFIFMGPSGAGKSTVADFGREIGDFVLDDDQLLVRESSPGSYSAAAWGTSLESSDLPVQGIFQLTKDVEDRLVPLEAWGYDQLLFRRFNDIAAGRFPDDLARGLLHLISRIVRQVPGYELRFRKSPDFWRLIDERFPASEVSPANSCGCK